MDPDQLLAEINELSRSGVHKLAGADAEKALGTLAHKVNQLIDWMSGGHRPPSTWVWAQRYAPGSVGQWPWTQGLVFEDGVWHCRSGSCKAPLDESSIVHTRDCTELPGAPADSRR